MRSSITRHRDGVIAAALPRPGYGELWELARQRRHPDRRPDRVVCALAVAHLQRSRPVGRRRFDAARARATGARTPRRLAWRYRRLSTPPMFGLLTGVRPNSATAIAVRRPYSAGPSSIAIIRDSDMPGRRCSGTHRSIVRPRRCATIQHGVFPGAEIFCGVRITVVD